MMCAWKELLSILPEWSRSDVDRLGGGSLIELRLRSGHPPELIRTCGRLFLKRCFSDTDLSFVINTASRYSPWAATSSAQGYITAPGGHRIGICGEAVIRAGEMTGCRNVSSLCIRVARDLPGLAVSLAELQGSILIIGRPGNGKTTLLRDLIRQRSCRGSVAVVDERGELFPAGFDRGVCTDVLTGCPKRIGVSMLLRTMSPGTIAVDEITSAEDCQALLEAGWCGVDLIATAHASCRSDLSSRRIYKPLLDQRLFDHLIVLRKDRSFTSERMER